LQEATHPVETIARLLDLSTRRVQQLSKEGVIPRAERGRYEISASVRGYIAYLKERSINPGVVSFDEVRARKTAAEAEMAEIDLKEKKGLLIPTEEVARSWAEIIGACRSKLLSMPAKIAPVVAVEEKPAICKQIVEEQVREALDELSKWVRNYEPDVDADIPDGGDAEAAIEIDGQPVG
jgi:phage terminase Nu1 subunit (DNA packaging protein)